MKFTEESEKSLLKWCLTELGPVAEAQNLGKDTLAEYAVELLKRDETVDSLKKICADELREYLEGETTAFVDRLFTHLRNAGEVRQKPLSL